MPRTPSALKALRQSERRKIRNRTVRSSLRTFVKKARTTVDGGQVEDAAELVKLAASQLDKAANKGIIHPNQAARRKSRLMHQLAVAGSAAAAPAEAKETAAAPARARARTATKATAAKPAAKPAEKPAAATRTRTPRARSTTAAEPKAEAEPKPRATRARRTTKE